MSTVRRTKRIIEDHFFYTQKSDTSNGLIGKAITHFLLLTCYILHYIDDCGTPCIGVICLYRIYIYIYNRLYSNTEPPQAGNQAPHIGGMADTSEALFLCIIMIPIMNCELYPVLVS